MIKPSGTVAHEQLAAGLKMWLKKLLSGFIISLIFIILVLVFTHSILKNNILRLYIPSFIDHQGKSYLLTFDGSGILNSKSTLIKNGKLFITSGIYFVILRDNPVYPSLIKSSNKMTLTAADNSFGFLSLLGEFIFGADKVDKSSSGNSLNIIGNKPINIDLTHILFKGKSVSVESELRHLFKSDNVSKFQYIKTLNNVFNGKIYHFRNLYISIIGYSFLIFPVFIFIWFMALRKISFNKTSDKFIRGASLMPFDSFINKLKESEMKRKGVMLEGKTGNEIKLIEKSFKLKCLKIGDLEIPRIYEITHLLLMGTTGCGKSVLINQLLSQINDRGDKCIIYDPKGEFYSKHGRPEDLIFYPFDERSVQYSILNEVTDLPDFHVLANSLIQPERAGENEFFYRGAQEIFAAALIFLYKNNKLTIRDILNFINLSVDQEAAAIRTLPLEFHSALAFLNKEDRSSHGVKGTLMSQVSFLRHMMDMKGDFSFRKYVKNESDRRNLYIMNKANFSGIFKPLMTFIIDTMILECLSLPDVKDDRRIFIIMDEFDSLGKLPSFLNGQKQLRSKGVSLICATQDLGGFETTYGKADMRSFFNNFNTNWIFRINDPETSDFLSKAFGEQEIKKLNESRSMSPSDYGDRQTLSEQDKIEKILLPSQLQILKNFQCYFKIANIGMTKFKIPEIFYEAKNPDFILNKNVFSIEDKLNISKKDDIGDLSSGDYLNDVPGDRISTELEKAERKLNFMKMISSMKLMGLNLTDLKKSSINKIDNKTDHKVDNKSDIFDLE